ncbi:HindIII family type II restriction endonuclease [Aerobium aerolatum]|uniref:Type II restriction enzyme n=1 Tax=Aquamicrobium aerolatum DSM 21857 TaxID=1121003 RepID=A0A1I3STP4_9HYPH|nr:HindIII family type II restriction endonuclease [Aquamicrobium aerolatum]SFJ62194.1 type II restriction enzyme [Aquamicrobium aerolatum DSM 21857]
MELSILTPADAAFRSYWVSRLKRISGNFVNDFEEVRAELSEDIKNNGLLSLKRHVRLCGNIPESYGHDTSEEKLYSKYTDAVLCEAYKAIGLKSIVITERADAADVEAFGKDKFSFVADAKAFRLSRTAKNQKDFKVQAMDGWKKGKPYAMVVCPIYQLPSSSSQIYMQASSRNVCVFTYSHLLTVINISEEFGPDVAERKLLDIFEAIKISQPSKSSLDYWRTVNKAMISDSDKIAEFWKVEKTAVDDVLKIAKEEDLKFLAEVREKIVRMDHQEAIDALLDFTKIDSKIKQIKSVTHGGVINLV